MATGAREGNQFGAGGPRRWLFGPAELDERSRELKVGGEVVALERKALEVLLHLLHHPGKVVTRDELLEAVWPGRVLTDASITACIAKLRSALRDEKQELIRTAHGYGYRLAAPVRTELTPITGRAIDDRPRSSRQLAAIMFSDIVGYTALIAEDERQGIAARDRHREVVQAEVRRVGGRWVEEVGDESFSTFPSALDAVCCARAIQAALAQEPKLSVRIGVHLGDVLEHDGRLIGDAVNIAARIRSEAPAGGTVISERVWEEVRNQRGIAATYLGERTLKNVNRPVRLYALTDAPAAARRRNGRHVRRLAAAAVVLALVAGGAAMTGLPYRAAASLALLLPLLGSEAIEQRLGFVTTTDGVRIAYAVTGDPAQRPPLVLAAGWMTHLERGINSPRHSGEFIRQITARRPLIRYDMRGMGLSDRGVADQSLDARVRDLEAIVDELKVERFFLSGVSAGAATAVAFAARHPERVIRLSLYGGYVRRPRPAPGGSEQRFAQAAFARSGWDLDNPAYRQFFASLLTPDATEVEMRVLTELQKIGATAEDAARFLETVVDIRDVAPRVRVPTIVVHRVGDLMVAFDEGRTLASLIPGARFVPIAGRNHMPLPREPEVVQIRDTIRQFFEEAPEAMAPPGRPAMPGNS